MRRTQRVSIGVDYLENRLLLASSNWQTETTVEKQPGPTDTVEVERTNKGGNQPPGQQEEFEIHNRDRKDYR